MKKNLTFKRRFFTLMEMMIVIVIIGLLMGVLVGNYAGGLNEAKALKTEAAMNNLSTILNIEAANDPSFLAEAQSEWQNVVRRSPLAKNPNNLLKDGWGHEFEIVVDDNNNIHVFSRTYEETKSRK
jgi:general secretion pathway protein G